MSILRTALALSALIGLTACGGNSATGNPPHATPTPTATTSTVAPASAAPSPKPTTLTRQQAASAYLKIIKPTNDMSAEPKCAAAEDFFVSGGEWPPTSHSDWPAAEKVLRACYLRLVPVMAASTKALQTTLWPLEARADMDDLISLDQAVLHCLRIGTRATTHEAMRKVFECNPDDDGSADRVRARFGLPRRST